MGAGKQEALFAETEILPETVPAAGGALAKTHLPTPAFASAFHA
jgi:hypothetical protein